MIRTFDIPFSISGTKITLPFSAVCTVTDKPFGGEIIIEYVPEGRVLEYVDAERFVVETCAKHVTAEELTHTVFGAVTASLKPVYVKVVVDVKHSDAHQPVQVWKEGGSRAI